MIRPRVVAYIGVVVVPIIYVNINIGIPARAIVIVSWPIIIVPRSVRIIIWPVIVVISRTIVVSVVGSWSIGGMVFYIGCRAAR